jgi:hypothetical protein
VVEIDSQVEHGGEEVVDNELPLLLPAHLKQEPGDVGEPMTMNRVSPLQLFKYCNSEIGQNSLWHRDTR